ncbi:hypothetical protein HHI36_017576 [Cryptolaemus montrouzieri]|uniref:Cytochrome P450 n=1 Tax=Cryptolaemus montrouzieri TaxID=559131 RepID=A0ABD2NND5_9CUCU
MRIVSTKMLIPIVQTIYFKTFILIPLAIVLVYVFKSCYRLWRELRLMSKFNGPKPTSLILGHWTLLTQPSDKLYLDFRAMARKFYPHYSMRILANCAVNILAPEDCEIIMGTKKHSSKSIIYDILKNWLNDGLLLSSGHKWFQRRRILTPAFHFNILRDFVPIFNEEAVNLVENISKNCGNSIDVVPLVSDFALNAINETAMGTKSDEEDRNQRAYRQAIHNIEEILRFRLMRPWYYMKFFYYFSTMSRIENRLVEVLHKFTRNIIQKKIDNFISNSVLPTPDDDEVYMSKKRKRLAMLDVLLQAKHDGEQIDYKGICEEVDTFMFEGHDTTSTALGFCLMLLANNPDIQEQVSQEIESVLGPERRKPNYNDLQKMDLLERCIKESLRLYPSVHFISRHCEEDVQLNSGLLIPKDAYMHIHIIDIHRNPDIYPNPERFDPDRFLPENCQNRHPYAYIPFSAGPRNCIGQRFAMLEMKAGLIAILQRFRMTAVDTPETVILKSEIILRTENGIKLIFIQKLGVPSRVVNDKIRRTNYFYN